MSTLKVFRSIEELKADRVARTTTSEEQVRQIKAAQSLQKIQPVSAEISS